MTTPRRIRLSRAKGWRMPANTIKVARPSLWGNPYKIGDAKLHIDGLIYIVENREHAAHLFDEYVEKWLRRFPDALENLRGKNLACWCPLDQPCHADVLLRLANQ